MGTYVTMEMERVRQSNLALNNDVDPLALIGCIDQQVTAVAGRLAIVEDAEHSRVVPLGTERVAGNEPPEKVVGLFNRYIAVPSDIRLGDVERQDRYVQGMIFICTFGRVLLSSCGWRTALGPFVAEDALDVEGLFDASAGVLVVGAHPIVANLLVGMYNYIVAFTCACQQAVDHMGKVCLPIFTLSMLVSYGTMGVKSVEITVKEWPESMVSSVA